MHFSNCVSLAAVFFFTALSTPSLLFSFNFYFFFSDCNTFILKNRYNSTMTEPEWRFLLSLSTSACVVCALIATITAKYLLMLVSPKCLQQLAHVANIAAIVIMAFGTKFAGSYEAFIVGRFLSGYTFGIFYGESL